MNQLIIRFKTFIVALPFLGPFLLRLRRWLRETDILPGRRHHALLQRITELEQSINARQLAFKLDVVRLLAHKQDRESRPVWLDNTMPTESVTMEQFYMDLETAFRAPAAELDTHFRYYLPFVTAKRQQCGDALPVIIDLGCGRGEWLKLLRSEGYDAVGVDMNQLAIELCRLDELNVIADDSVRYLQRCDSESVDVITAFHMVEHLPVEVLLQVLAECRRVLKPDGVLILETPNPENLVVSAYTFYFDPTHRHPLPPALLRFMVEQQGFVGAEVHRFNPRDEVNPELALTQNWFMSAADYAVIASK